MRAPVPDEVPFVPLEKDAGDATAFACPLCGARFTHGVLVCQSCPMNAGCEIVKCPSCGYQFPRRSKVLDWAKKLLSSGRRG
jgi:uncharacterized Zn-finger protein